MKVKLDWETTDAIVLQGLKAQRKYLSKELKRYFKNPQTTSNLDGVWMHPDDVILNTEMIECMDKLISYYGG